MKYDFPRYDSKNFIPYCVSSSGACRFSGHGDQEAKPYFMGKILGFIIIPIFLTLLFTSIRSKSY